MAAERENAAAIRQPSPPPSGPSGPATPRSFALASSQKALQDLSPRSNNKAQNQSALSPMHAHEPPAPKSSPFLASKHRSTSNVSFVADKNAHGTAASQAECPVHAYAGIGVPSFDARFRTLNHGASFGSARRLFQPEAAEGPDFIDANAKMAVLKASPRGVSWGSTPRHAGGSPKAEGSDFISSESTLVSLPRAPGGVSFGRTQRLLHQPTTTENCAYLSQEAAAAATKATLSTGPGGVAFGSTKRSVGQATHAEGPGFISADAKFAILKSAPRGVAWGATPRFLGQKPGFCRAQTLPSLNSPRCNSDAKDNNSLTRPGLMAPLRT
jgi:hypothetical protein